MPTTWSRSWAIPLALEWWRRQSYAGELELVVVASGPDGEKVADLVTLPFPDGDRVAFEFMPGAPTLGAKHNRAVDLATHDWLAKWDDDDWQARDRLALTMTAALAGGVEVASVEPCLYHDLEAGASYRYRYRHGREGGSRPPWVWGNGLIFTRGLWERHPFDPRLPRGVDTAWIWGALGRFGSGPHADGVTVTDAGRPLCVVLAHGPSTGRRQRFEDMDEFQRYPDLELELGGDLMAIEEAWLCRSRA